MQSAKVLEKALLSALVSSRKLKSLLLPPRCSLMCSAQFQEPKDLPIPAKARSIASSNSSMKKDLQDSNSRKISWACKECRRK